MPAAASASGTATLVVLAVAALAAPPVLAQREEQDAWAGKSRNEIVTLLGEPDKVNRSKKGETLVYHVFHVEQAALTDPDLVPVLVPGVGLVARRSGPSEAQHQKITYEPTVLDEDGHPQGGLTTTESHSVSWSKKDGKTVQSGELPRTASLRRAKLTFRLDASGHVRDWSVAPKAGASGP